MTTPMQASKWLQLQVLLDTSEMEDLLSQLGDFDMFITGSATKKGGEKLERKTFLEIYSSYIESLKEGCLPESALYRSVFSAAFSVVSNHFFVLPLDEEKQLLRISKPVIQMQSHRMGYSSFDRKFRSMIFGNDCIEWGIQFSYPQLYQDPETKIIEKIGAAFPNSALFHTLRQWCRRHTLPTPFVVDQVRINVPIRLGKKCFSWINRHPQLVEKNMTVRGLRED